MRCKKYFFIVAFFLSTLKINAEAAKGEAHSTDVEAQKETHAPVADSATQRRLRCQEFAFGAGCQGFGFGPVVTSDKSGAVYGLSASYTYFLFERLGAGLGGGMLFGSTYKQYSIGPSLTYFIGPFAGYLLTPSFGATKYYLRGGVDAEGWSYGPSVGLMSNLFGRVYWGISVGYYTFVVGSSKTSEWSWSPAVFIPF